MFWHGQYFVAVNGLTLLMFWHSRCFGAVNGLALSMFRHGQCFGTVNILEWLMFWRSRTNAGERQSLRDLKYQPHLYAYFPCATNFLAPNPPGG